MVPLFFLTPNSTILTPGRGSPLLSVTVPLISIPAADAAVFIIPEHNQKEPRLHFDPFMHPCTFELGEKEKEILFSFFIKFKINFSIKSRTFIIDAKLVNKECKLLTLFA